MNRVRSPRITSRIQMSAVPPERTAIATLLVVVAKLFLVDLAALEALFRVVLFLGFGSVFLLLSYLLQDWWKGERARGPSGEAG